MKGLILIPLVIVVSCGLIFGVCAESSPAPAKPIELNFASISVPTHPLMKGVILPWPEKLEKATNGRLKVTVYPAQGLVKGPDAYQGAVSGRADISYALQSFTPGRFPLSEVILLPFMVPNSTTGSKIFWALYEKFPELRAEYKDVHMLWLNTTASTHFWSKKPVHKVEDAKGMKLSATGEVVTNIVKSLGATPVQMTAQDSYLALQRGVIDGDINTWSSNHSHKIEEVTKYVAEIGFWGFAMFTVMNLDVWNKLPPEIQKVVNEYSGAKYAELAGISYDAEEKEALNAIRKAEVVYYKPTAEELKGFRDTAKQVWDKWVANVEAKGLPGRKVLNEAVRLLEKYHQ